MGCEHVSMTNSMRRQRLEAGIARSDEDVLAAQRLRFRVFADELGARLPDAHLGIDRDRFDPYCEHLIVRDVVAGESVGTYRILSHEQARRVGGFYSETEFHLTRVLGLRGLVELGRACVDPRHRNGTVLAFLWSA